MSFDNSRFGALLLAIAVVASTPAVATPITFKDAAGVWRWSKGSTIDIWVAPDGTLTGGRSDAVIKGINLWKDLPPLKDSNISIVVHEGFKPADKPGIPLTFSPAPASKGADGLTTIANPGAHDTSLNSMVDKIVITADPSTTGDKYTSLAGHEFGHLLGLADDHTNASAIMYYKSPPPGTPETTSLSTQDKEELKVTYNALPIIPPAPGGSKIKVIEHHKLLSSDEGWEYDYDLTWEDGSDLALFSLETPFDAVSEVNLPFGWKVDDFIVPLDVDYSSPPHSAAGKFLQFIVGDEQSYIGPDNPTLHFSFNSTRTPGFINGFLDGDITVVGPSAAPEPNTWLYVIGGLGLIGLGLRRSRGQRGAVSASP